MYQVIHSMCKSRDMIAIASLHQPRREIFLEIDHMMLLAHGRAVYCGPSREMVPFIETFHRPIESQENPADFAIDFLFKLKDDQAEQLANANDKMQGAVPLEGASYMGFIDPVSLSLHRLLHVALHECGVESESRRGLSETSDRDSLSLSSPCRNTRSVCSVRNCIAQYSTLFSLFSLFTLLPVSVVSSHASHFVLGPRSATLSPLVRLT